jgi:phosphatidylglycerophosphatase A
MSALSLAYPLGTWFGLGRAPKAPGTVGSLGAIPLHLLLCRVSPALHVASVLVSSVVGVWAAQKIADEEEEKDPSHVVIDEVAGTLIAMGLVRTRSLGVQLAAFALFRLLDITKPGPIGSAEQAQPAGLGIMLDDLLAGLVAGLLARTL